MQFVLDNVLPVPLADSPLSENTLWRKKTVLNSSEHILAEAPSGTGKTTLVSILYGHRKDYTGVVTLNDKDIYSFDPEDWAKLRREKLSAVFQDLRLFPQLTGMQNVLIKNQLQPVIEEEEIRQLAVELRISHRMDMPCGKMSLGQQQRVAILRALAMPFEFILLDEPFSHLDEENAAIAAAVIQRYCEKNKAGLLVTSLGPCSYFRFTQHITI